MGYSGLSCGSTTIKYLLFIFNLFFLACGIALIVVAAIPLANPSLSEDHSNVALIFVVAVGAIIFLISFFGCCGAVQESRCMLITFAACLAIIVVLQITGVVLAFVNGSQVKIDNRLKNIFQKAIKNDQDATVMTDALQQTFKCCGYNGPTSWSPHAIPTSCCADKLSGTSCKFYEKSCKTEAESYIKKYVLAIGIVGVVVAVVEFIGIWFALALAHSLKNSDERGDFAPVPNNPLQSVQV